MNPSISATNCSTTDHLTKDRRRLSGFWDIFAAFLTRLRERAAPHPQRLRILERHALGPKQSLVLIEAAGRTLLVASSHEAAPVFFALDALPLPDDHGQRISGSHDAASSIHLEPQSGMPVRSQRSRRRVL